MRMSIHLATAAIGAAALLSGAQAAPFHYEFTAIAQGDVNGPIRGSFTIDPAHLWQTYDLLSTEGEPVHIEAEEPDVGWGFIDWALPGDRRVAGTIWGAGFNRTLLANGGSTLTISTFAGFSRGTFGEQDFQLTYTSNTDALYTQRNPFLALDKISSATGSLAHNYSSTWGDPSFHLNYSFTVTATAVPEPDAASIGLAGWSLAALVALARRRSAKGTPIAENHAHP
ncbi:MAG: hypothetical protein EOP38_07515 [Rubrivivax sp.]|nr:MAG: hypothetical protein EOP38_07515 [Rubrivivax sp.]